MLFVPRNERADAIDSLLIAIRDKQLNDTFVFSTGVQQCGYCSDARLCAIIILQRSLGAICQIIERNGRMNIQISKILKSLRQKNEKTQDELATFLGITSQAVSKWERGEGYPDITLLPEIAGFFHVSMDTLFGVDEIAKQNRIEAITAEYNRLRHHIPIDPDYRLDEGIDLIRNALKETPGEFFFEQLLAADLSWKGKNLSDTVEKTKLYEEAILLCEDILARSVEDRWRSCANQILIVMYADLGMTEKALELAYQMPGPHCTCEYMLTYIQSGEELQSRLKLNAILYYRIFRESVLKFSETMTDAESIVHRNELSIAGIGEEEYMSAIKNVLLHP